MQEILVDQLKPNLSFTGDLLLDSSFILLPHATPVSAELIKALNEWHFESVFCDGAISLGGDIGIYSNKSDSDSEEFQKISFKEVRAKTIENFKSKTSDDNEKVRMEMVQEVYNLYMDYIEYVFTHYATHKEIDQKELADTVQELCIFIKDHKRFILRINPSTDSCTKNFLVIHSMRTTVLALAIAFQLHLPLSKMIELGVSCILHEIGMLNLPPQLYMTNKRLTEKERKQMTSHTLFGYKILNKLNFPLTEQLAVLDHHEKENGTGYPQGKSGNNISSAAKIIAVACSYEAISSVRKYKEEKTTFDALLEMLQNKENNYDNNVLKALLLTVSFYPIGSYVYLSNRKVAIVIDTNPENPKCPVVQLLTEKEKDGTPKTIQTSKEISILRILSKKEQQDILNLINHKAQIIENAKKAAENPAFIEDVIPLEEVEEDTIQIEVKKPVEPISTSPNVGTSPSVTPAPKPAPQILQKPAAPAASTSPSQKPAAPAANASGPIEDVDINMFN